MIQLENISKNASCSGVKSPVVRQSFVTQQAPDMEFLIQFFSGLIISRQIQNKGNQQAILTLVSAGNDLRVSTMRPDPKSAKLNSEGEIQGLSSVDFSDN